MKELGKRRKGTLKRLEQELETDPAWQEEFDPKQEPEKPKQPVKFTIELEKRELEQPGGQIMSLAASGGYLAAGLGTLLRFKRNGKNYIDDSYPFGAWDDKSGEITGIDFSNIHPAGGYLALGSRDGRLQVYRVTYSDNRLERKMENVFEAKAPKTINTIKFMDFSQHLAFTYDNVMQFFNFELMSKAAKFEFTKIIGGIAFHTDGVAVAYAENIRFCKAPSADSGGLEQVLHKRINEDDKYNFWINSMEFSPDFKHLAVVGGVAQNPGFIRLYHVDYDEHRLVREISLVGQAETQEPKHVAFIGNDKLVTTCGDYSLQYWNIGKNE
jgi:WD40 repeat protein